MLKHLTERVILKDKNSGADTLHRDTGTVVNGTNLQPLLDKAEVKPLIRETEVSVGPEKELKKTAVVLPVVEIPTTEPVKQMIGSGMIAASVEGVAVQNGLTTLNQASINIHTDTNFLFRRTSKRRPGRKFLKQFWLRRDSSTAYQKMQLCFVTSTNCIRLIRLHLKAGLKS